MSIICSRVITVSTVVVVGRLRGHNGVVGFGKRKATLPSATKHLILFIILWSNIELRNQLSEVPYKLTLTSLFGKWFLGDIIIMFREI